MIRTSSFAGVPGLGRGRVALCAGVIALAGVWAFWPLGSPEATPSPTVSDPSGTLAPWRPAELRIAAFSAPLWVAPPAPPAAPSPEPKALAPPPLKLQLLAVVNQDGVYQAVLFDPDADQLYTLREGETLGTRTVERVSVTGVDLRDAAGLRTLALQDPEAKR